MYYAGTSIFFFHGYRAHRDLHSFPTRRSSDLNEVARRTEERVAPKRWFRPPGAAPEVAFVARSEEHTSELQSHSDLVCRLLLEKKKKKERPTLKLSTQRSPPNSLRHYWVRPTC